MADLDLDKLGRRACPPPTVLSTHVLLRRCSTVLANTTAEVDWPMLFCRVCFKSELNLPGCSPVLSVVVRRCQGRPDGDSAVSTPLDIHLENTGKMTRYRWHLGCILLKMAAISLSTGGLESTDGLKNA